MRLFALALLLFACGPASERIQCEGPRNITCNARCVAFCREIPAEPGQVVYLSAAWCDTTPEELDCTEDG